MRKIFVKTLIVTISMCCSQMAWSFGSDGSEMSILRYANLSCAEQVNGGNEYRQITISEDAMTLTLERMSFGNPADDSTQFTELKVVEYTGTTVTIMAEEENLAGSYRVMTIKLETVVQPNGIQEAEVSLQPMNPNSESEVSTYDCVIQ